MDSSVLTTIKNSLGVVESDTSFDPDILMHTNTVFSTLNQIGVGPENGIQIEDKESTWDELLGTDPRLNFVKSFVYLKVRLLFDPPPTSFAIQAIENQVKELEFRIYTLMEVEKWQTATPS